MIQRCENPKNQGYKDYGGRGIKVCDSWHDPKVFISWALENGYSEELSIDRKENNGNYEPDNCRWVTMKIQANNKRNNTPCYPKTGTKPIILYGLEDFAAEIPGMDRHKLSVYYQRGKLPEPYSVNPKGKSPAWTREQIEHYKSTRHLTGE